jgi:hypothetical protein
MMTQLVGAAAVKVALVLCPLTVVGNHNAADVAALLFSSGRAGMNNFPHSPLI